ncbi:type I 3-dehydroquinate dehydratase [Frigoribacterium sp. 2-23]|uniref:type I 3-dehydroquinate dehydratase n=1 Tax=Frigoribacterium sp. 2-23 TaxID=3415006 RepID=UPI003C6EF725
MAAPIPVTLRSVVLADGRPAVCVPLVDTTVEALVASAASLDPRDYDVVELRVDHVAASAGASAGAGAGATASAGAGAGASTGADAAAGAGPIDAGALARAVREALPDDKPLLFTFRTEAEGGACAIAPDEYERLIAAAVESGAVDAVDVEMTTEPDARERIVDHAHAHDVPVVMSSHDFDATPDQAEIVSRLLQQQEWGADVVKVAVMPQSPADVLTLLAATDDYRRGPGLLPAITMSMGPLGVVSRVAGETFGSCLTFGSAGRASAPGQLDAHELRAVVDLLHAARR